MQVSQKEKGYGIKLDDGEWYNDWGECPVAKGDRVIVYWEPSGKWRNIKSVAPVSKAETSPITKAMEPKPKTTFPHFTLEELEAKAVWAVATAVDVIGKKMDPVESAAVVAFAAQLFRAAVWARKNE